MTLTLPLYVVNGEKIASFEELPDGRGRILGWDFELGELTREAADIGEFFGGGSETIQITKEEFDERLEELRGGSTS